MNDSTSYENSNMPDKSFPINLFKVDFKEIDTAFESHWHKHFELLYFTKGEAIVQCNSITVPVKAKDLVVVNSNELHSAKSLSKELIYYVFIIDTSLLRSSFFDACEIKYITPILQNLILFKNKINRDKNVLDCIRSIIKEYELKQTGFELSIKSYLYRLIVLLMRNHVEKKLTENEGRLRESSLERLYNILTFLNDNFNEEVYIADLSRQMNISTFHFCRLFKSITGKKPTEYINQLRIIKAEALLKNPNISITEIALNTGFGDANYFSRAFKKYRNISPSQLRKTFLNTIDNFNNEI